MASLPMPIRATAFDLDVRLDSTVATIGALREFLTTVENGVKRREWAVYCLGNQFLPWRWRRYFGVRRGEVRCVDVSKLRSSTLPVEPSFGDGDLSMLYATRRAVCGPDWLPAGWNADSSRPVQLGSSLADDLLDPGEAELFVRALRMIAEHGYDTVFTVAHDADYLYRICLRPDEPATRSGKDATSVAGVGVGANVAGPIMTSPNKNQISSPSRANDVIGLLSQLFVVFIGAWDWFPANSVFAILVGLLIWNITLFVLLKLKDRNAGLAVLHNIAFSLPAQLFVPISVLWLTAPLYLWITELPPFWTDG